MSMSMSMPNMINMMDIAIPSIYRPSIMDEAFGWEINPRDWRSMIMAPRQIRNQINRQISAINQDIDIMMPMIGKEGFQVIMDISQFQPNEIIVKTIDNIVIVEGKHEERQDDHGYISRQFTRKYSLPKGYDSNTIISTISSDGILTIKAPTPQQDQESNARIIEIQHTGPARSSIKQNPESEIKMKK